MKKEKNKFIDLESDFEEFSRFLVLDIETFKKYKCKLNWVEISRRGDLTFEFIKEFQYLISKEIFFSNYPNLNLDILDLFKKELFYDGKEKHLKMYCKESWKYISSNINLTFEFVEKYQDYLNWNVLSKSFRMDEKFMDTFKDKINWSFVSQFQILDEKLIEKYSNLLNWDKISKYQKLSSKFINKYKLKLNFNNLIKYQKLDEKIIRKYLIAFTFDNLTIYQKLSMEFIEEYLDNLNFQYLIMYQNLSMEFIEKHIDKWNFHTLSKYQKLSSEFIDKYIERFNWFNLMTKQELNEELVLKHIKSVDGRFIVGFQNFSINFYEEVAKKYNIRDSYKCYTLYPLETLKFLIKTKKIKWLFGEITKKIPPNEVVEYLEYLPFNLICSSQDLPEKVLLKYNTKNNFFNFIIRNRISPSFGKKYNIVSPILFSYTDKEALSIRRYRSSPNFVELNRERYFTKEGALKFIKENYRDKYQKYKNLILKAFKIEVK